ncbi:hypothetical protein [Xenorhabdus bovienii]|uniref:hypothetical protein n=1 Tax=Xenorhabdus bovienii TaxID=40576 RepID=UPI0004D4B1CC|nr:hypothetical protein [Xenorhabdus bovienii]CDG89813.1 conserved hypothetical protein [Xenorhabdus bovienii str. feltiae France]CDG94486.1 conserved hypothetical protein [Xenorhabdus bovienii str. feltiae Florida]
MHPTNDLARPITHSEPDSVDSYLATLGLAQDDLNAILRRGLSGRYSTTQNHPVTSRGQYFYGEAVSGAREILSFKGFKKLSIRNVELTVSDSIAIYICRGCDQTGLVHGYPESRMKKGDFTCELMGLIRSNNPGQGLLSFEGEQMNFGFEFLDDKPLLPNKLGLDLWFLLYNFYKIDEHQLGIKAELSRPITYSQKNIVNGFSTRLILNTAPTDPVIKQGEEPQFTSEIEIDILKTG